MASTNSISLTGNESPETIRRLLAAIGVSVKIPTKVAEPTPKTPTPPPSPAKSSPKPSPSLAMILYSHRTTHNTPTEPIITHPDSPTTEKMPSPFSTPNPNPSQVHMSVEEETEPLKADSVSDVNATLPRPNSTIQDTDLGVGDVLREIEEECRKKEKRKAPLPEVTDLTGDGDDDDDDDDDDEPLIKRRVRNTPRQPASAISDEFHEPPPKRGKTGSAPRRFTRSATAKLSKPLQSKKTIKTVAESKALGQRVVIRELLYDPEFLISNGMSDLVDMVRHQGWEKLFCKAEEVNESLLRQFYTSFSMMEKPHALQGTFLLGKKTHIFSSIELGLILGIPHSGFEEYVKGQWPRETGIDAIQRVSQDLDTKAVGEMSTTSMGVVNRVLHSYLISNITPREQKRTTILIQDFLLMDRLLLREQINLPKVIMHHMAHARKNDRHGLPFPGIVRKILEYLRVYESGDGDSVFAQELAEANLRKMRFERNDVGDWMRISDTIEPEVSAEDPPEEHIEALNGVYYKEGMEALCKLVAHLSEQQRRLVKEIAGLKEEIRSWKESDQ